MSARGGGGGHQEEHQHRRQQHPRSHQLQLPSSRTQSLRLPTSPGSKSPPCRSSRFSWGNSFPHDSCHEASISLKDSKYRGSVTSLASDVGSGATTPTPLAPKGAAFDISAKDLLNRTTVHHSGQLEMKKTSGFKSYKKFFAVLDSHFLYLYARERDSKAKQVIDVSAGCTVENSDLKEEKQSSGSQVSSGGANNGSFRDSKKGRGGRSFELLFNQGESRFFAAPSREEAEEWMRKLRQQQASKVYERDHVALEQDFLEEEVLHECMETGMSKEQVQQEWRIALSKHHWPSEDASR